MVTAERLLITESSDDMAAAITPTMAIPFSPSGNSIRNNSGSAILKFGVPLLSGSASKNPRGGWRIPQYPLRSGNRAAPVGIAEGH